MSPPTHNLQTNRRIHILFRLVHLIAELILRILRCVARVFDIFGLVDGRDGEDGCWVVEQVPLRCVAPVAGLVVRCCSAEGGWAEDHVDFVRGGGAAGVPGLGVGGAVGVSLAAKLLS